MNKYLSYSVLIFILLPLLLPSSGIAPQEVIIKCYTWDPIAQENVECSSVSYPGYQQHSIFIYVKPDNVDLPITWTITYSDRPYYKWTDTNDETSLHFIYFCLSDTDSGFNFEMTVTAENDFGSVTNSYTVDIECKGGATSLYFPTIVHLPRQATREP